MSKPSFESLESRRLLTFTAIDADFGVDGRAAVPGGVASISDLRTTRINDGRLVVTGNERVRFLRGDGAVDTRRAPDGLRILTKAGTTIVDVAVDPKTGYLALLRMADATSTIQGFEIYDAKGRLINNRPVSVAVGGKVAFDPDGNLLIATTTTSLNGTVTEYRAQVQRFIFNTDPAGGGTAVNPFLYGTRNSDSVLPPSIEALRTDDAGRIYLFTRAVASSQGDMITTTTDHVRRYSASGVYDSAWAGGTNPVQIASAYSDDFDQNRNDIDDVVVTGQGTIYTLVRSFGFKSESGAESDRLSLLRFDASLASKRASIEVGATPGVSRHYGGSSLAAVGDGTLLVSAATGGAMHVFRYDATTLAVTPGWSDFGSYQSTVSLGTTRISMNAHGQYLLTSMHQASVFAYDIDGTFAAPPAGQTTFRADGMLIVSGTSKSDTVEIRLKKSRVLVDLNGKDTLHAHSQAVLGVVVLGGNGNDRVDAVGSGRSFTQFYFDGGAGNDTLAAGDRDDTLVGGSGDDSLVGAFGEDYLYGQDGRDTLYGNASADVLYGGRDNDYLASHVASGVNDVARDTLFGGGGRDTFRTEFRQSTSDPDQFTVIGDRSDEDKEQSALA